MSSKNCSVAPIKITLTPKGYFFRFLSAIFRLESFLVRLFYRLTGLKPSSKPFLSSDGFRRLARWRYEPGRIQRFQAEKVRPGDVVYCKADFLKSFFLGPAKQIKEPFTLVSGNMDINLDKALLDLIPPQLMRWYAQNLVEQHRLVEALPIGLENRRLHWHGLPADYVKLRKKSPKKKTAILYGFAVSTNPLERQEALDVLTRCSLAQALAQRLNSRIYRRVLAEYQFVASPPGNGLDCHRTWEALYLKVVPIVKDSLAMRNFEKLGLPLVIVQQWDELLAWDEEYLVSLYQEKEKDFNNPALWMDFWQEKMQQLGKG